MPSLASKVACTAAVARIARMFFVRAQCGGGGKPANQSRHIIAGAACMCRRHARAACAAAVHVVVELMLSAVWLR